VSSNSSVAKHVQRIHSLLKNLNRNSDGKITIDGIQLFLRGLGLTLDNSRTFQEFIIIQIKKKTYLSYKKIKSY